MRFVFSSLLGNLALIAAQSSVISSAPYVSHASGATGLLGDAAAISDNPVGDIYTAVLPDSNKTTIRGFISARGYTGTGVAFEVVLVGLPHLSLGPFTYHIHDQPIPLNGSCASIKAHLDPYIRGERSPCDSTKPHTCQVGDLSGKHGVIITSSYSAGYVDYYVSTKPGIGAFLGNRSIVVHTSNNSRLACANFSLSDPVTAIASTMNGCILRSFKEMDK
ncbi:MAG: hypothetical protein M1816_001184 [Peltula sp. TS41687]|nr:MAG: hypothetical protein M1816_001184 [Peltula sp. TS41687]